MLIAGGGKWARILFWPLLCLCLICYFIVIPIYKVGLWQFIGTERQINPITRRLSEKYCLLQARSLSQSWYERVERIYEKDIPHIIWQEDTVSSKGINSFYCLDQQSYDVRALLMPEWNLSYDRLAWWNAQKTGEYLFNPENSPSPIYKIQRTDSTVHIKTGTKLDTWIYLVAKQKQPTVYAIDFDFTPNTQTQETLQICFATSSLAQRFRFNLENNKTMKFDVVDHGNFLYWPHEDLWKNLRFPYSLPLKKSTHVQLQCINNVFALFFDSKLVMAVRVRDYEAKSNPWYLIFWNGTEQLGDDQDMYMDISIKNFKILHQKT